MADVTASATIGLTFSVYAAGSSVVSMGLATSIKDDLNVIDNLEDIVLRKKGKATRNDAGVLTYPSLIDVPLIDIKRTRVGIREAVASGGTLRSDDVKFRVPQHDVPERPTEQWEVIADDGTWDVLMVDSIMLSTQYRLYCRR